jgi:hypothetical protein
LTRLLAFGLAGGLRKHLFNSLKIFFPLPADTGLYPVERENTNKKRSTTVNYPGSIDPRHVGKTTGLG